jgi:segregation and condensation protein B
MDLSKKIEAILFFRGEPVSKAFLSKTLAVSIREVDTAIAELKETLTERGVVLLDNESEVALGTNPEFRELIESITSEEIEKDLTKAALETLSIILYRSPVSRAEIDFIRGVNSTFMLRSLLVRGLIERALDPRDRRSYVYKPSIELLAHLGVTSAKDLPAYDATIQQVSAFMDENKESEDSK